MKLYPPITLYQGGQELKATGYTMRESERKFLRKSSEAEYNTRREASKVMLNVHKYSEAMIIKLMYEMDLYRTVSDLDKGIDISSLAPRLEVKTEHMCCKLPNLFAKDCIDCEMLYTVNFVFLKPEQPVEESQDELFSAFLKLIGELLILKDGNSTNVDIIKSKFIIKRK